MIIDVNKLSEQWGKLPIFDWHASLKLVNQNKNIANQLLNSLLQSLPEEIITIQSLLATENLDGLLALMHKLHGLLCYISAPRLKAATQASEKILRQELYKHNQSLRNSLINMVISEAKQLLALGE